MHGLTCPCPPFIPFLKPCYPLAKLLWHRHLDQAPSDHQGPETLYYCYYCILFLFQNYYYYYCYCMLFLFQKKRVSSKLILQSWLRCRSPVPLKGTLEGGVSPGMRPNCCRFHAQFSKLTSLGFWCMRQLARVVYCDLILILKCINFSFSWPTKLWMIFENQYEIINYDKSELSDNN